MKYVGVVGSRRRNRHADYQLLKETLSGMLDKGDVLVSGGCKQGADAFAEIIARDEGLSILIHHADWVGLGKGAGFARNTLIAEDSDMLVAVVASDRTGGTEDTVRKAEKLGKKVILL
jgi:predicted Rossmann fold nucleotide-binding protein DprA/Smf involved in DNA uptake